jgi:hypothetical protein
MGVTLGDSPKGKNRSRVLENKVVRRPKSL